MKIDLYTKGILTVIALSLVVMAFKDVSPVNEAFAQSNKVHKIAICNSDGEPCASIRTRDSGVNYIRMWWEGDN
tara:strand:+ start:81 stop:302 length:222 start_codon:yes stop_codon:yes gene_type:complete